MSQNRQLQELFSASGRKVTKRVQPHRRRSGPLDLSALVISAQYLSAAKINQLLMKVGQELRGQGCPCRSHDGSYVRGCTMGVLYMDTLSRKKPLSEVANDQRNSKYILPIPVKAIKACQRNDELINLHYGYHTHRSTKIQGRISSSLNYYTNSKHLLISTVIGVSILYVIHRKIAYPIYATTRAEEGVCPGPIETMPEEISQDFSDQVIHGSEFVVNVRANGGFVRK